MLTFRFPPSPRHLRVLRRSVRRGLRERGVSRDLTDSVVLVLDELVSNAIDHANDYREHHGLLQVRLEVDDDHVLLDFEDPDMPEAMVERLAAAMRDSSGDPPPLDSERGRGLFLVVIRSEDLVVERRSGGGLLLRGRFTEENA